MPYMHILEDLNKRTREHFIHLSTNTEWPCDTVTQTTGMTLGRPPGSKKSKRSGTSSSVHVHHLYSSRSLTGRTTLRQEVLNATAIRKRQAKDHEEYSLCQDAMTMSEKDELNAIRSNTTNDSRSGSVDNNNLEHEAWEMDVNSILSGEETMDISHAGGEYSSIIEIGKELLSKGNK